MITQETRKESYIAIQKKLGTRHEQVLTVMRRSSICKKSGSTANEIAWMLERHGYTKYFNRNFSQPRLNELVQAGLVAVVDKRVCAITGITCAVYKIEVV